MFSSSNYQKELKMKTKMKTILLCSVILTLGACNSRSGMYEDSGPRYMPRAEIAQRNYTSANHMEDRADKTSYKKYEQREPCQNYRDLPRKMVDRCVTAEDNVELATTTISKNTERSQRVLPIVSSYTILFDHDKAHIRGDENETLDRAMREIAKYNPSQVTVTGYTDSSGNADYNQNLSRQREQTVSKALLSRGIVNQTLEREARGEYEQAVQTDDGIRNQENRRVVIDFRR
jgi:outer membrane protein OmpA-like peptidoglycan-associated protein